MRVGDGTGRVMVSKRTLKRCKENVEEQKEVLNDSSAQRLQEIKRLRRSPSQKLQSTQFLPPAKLPPWPVDPDPDWGGCPRQSWLWRVACSCPVLLIFLFGLEQFPEQSWANQIHLLKFGSGIVKGLREFLVITWAQCVERDRVRVRSSVDQSWNFKSRHHEWQSREERIEQAGGGRDARLFVLERIREGRHLGPLPFNYLYPLSKRPSSVRWLQIL